MGYVSIIAMTNQVLQVIQDQAEQGEFDALDEAMQTFTQRVDELHWREDTETGRLYVGDDEFGPEHIFVFKLEDGEILAEEADGSEINWSSLARVSSPDTTTNPQFD